MKSSLKKEDKVIWMHTASLGEYEQGLPVLEGLKMAYPNHKFLLTFFSPSGFEVKKDKTPADVVSYLPLDTLQNTRKFVSLTNLELAIFIKYEIWPNYLYALKKQNIPTLLVSALFSKRQVFFKPFGGFMRRSLEAFSHFFVQNEDSKALLKSIGYNNTTVNGDTRFDRVSQILTRDNSLPFMDVFKQNAFCVVVGSSWPEDEELVVNFINASKHPLKYVIAPHDIKKGHIDKLKHSITKKTICYSEISEHSLETFEVLIIDTIGLLTKIYSYADVAYVGGGFATGLHNTLEPAVFGIPVIIGPEYSKFKEATELVERGGIISIVDQDGFNTVVEKLLSDSSLPKKTGAINTAYVGQQQGATKMVVDHITKML